jgi:hypothetical protein
MRSSTSTVRGKKVELVLGAATGSGGRQQHGVVIEVGGDGATGLLGEASGLEPDRAGAELAVVDGGFGELNLWTLHWALHFFCQ